jgi:P pilus assembly chaperone PapD
MGGKAQGMFEVTNPTNRQLVVGVSTADFLLRANGTAVVSPKVPSARSARKWLKVSPATLRLAPGATASLRVTSNAPKKASPGDHHALVQFTTAPTGSGTVRTRTQIGLPVLVRTEGPLLRKLAIASLRVAQAKSGRTLRLVVRNEGNINERLARRAVSVKLTRNGKSIGRLAAPARTILPGERTVYSLPLAKSLAGAATGLVRVRPAAATLAGQGAPHLRPLSKAFRLRLGDSR